jgi:hypothetical protein
MSQQERDILRTEAMRSLRGYLNTGLNGFKQKAIDRLRALDIDTQDTLDRPDGPTVVLFALEKGIL